MGWHLYQMCWCEMLKVDWRNKMSEIDAMHCPTLWIVLISLLAEVSMVVEDNSATCPLRCISSPGNINCSSSGLTEVPSQIPCHYHTLMLQHNYIHNISLNAFHNCTYYMELQMGNGKSEDLPKARHHGNRLNMLNLSFNKIGEVPSNAFVLYTIWKY